LGFIEAGSGLEGVAFDVVKGDLERLSCGLGNGGDCRYGGGGGARREKRLEALSQGAAFWVGDCGHVFWLSSCF
jgi:hypothetical protein